MVEQVASVKKSEIGNASIKVVGVGGGGQNAVNRMFRERVPGVDYIAINTDAQALDSANLPTEHKLRVGDETARGLGVGGDPSRGKQCHEENREEIKQLLQGADLVFVASGMGGGTGTGGAPVVAEIAQELNCLTVGVITKPFNFEGQVRSKKATEGIEQLSQHVDTMVVIPNDRLMAVSDENLTMTGAFEMADDVLAQGVQSIAELILVPGEINLDFADVRAVMENAGPAWMAIGKGTGEDRAIKAAEEAINSPLLEVEITGAKGVIFNITGGSDLTLEEVQKASEVISSTVHPDANIIFGNVIDSNMENEVKLTVIATGFPKQEDLDQIDRKTTIDVIKNPESVKIPPFLRKHPSAVRRIRGGMSKTLQLGLEIN
ncbi:MAG: cell division protein FtsZ [Chloroflexi bacterium]|nr:cell division protein FtsZ [Chloroflexota bacterium]